MAGIASVSVKPALRLALLAALFLAGCAAPNQVPNPSRVEPSGLTGDQVLALYQATDDWYVATGGKVDLTNYAGEPLPVSAGLANSERACAETIFEPDGPIHIDVDVELTDKMVKRFPDMWRFMFEHELGHALGLDHEPGTLMEAPRKHAGACVDAVSLARVCANYGGCYAGSHPTCEE